MLVKRNTGMLFKINSARDITQTCKGRALFVYTDSPNGPVAVPISRQAARHLLRVAKTQRDSILRPSSVKKPPAFRSATPIPRKNPPPAGAERPHAESPRT